MQELLGVVTQTMNRIANDWQFRDRAQLSSEVKVLAARRVKTVIASRPVRPGLPPLHLRPCLLTCSPHQPFPSRPNRRLAGPFRLAAVHRPSASSVSEEKTRKTKGRE